MRPARIPVTIAVFSLGLVGALVAPAVAAPAGDNAPLEVEVTEDDYDYDPGVFEEPVVDPSWEPPAADVWEPEPMEEVGEIGAPPDEPWVPADLDLEEEVQEAGVAARMATQPSQTARGGDRGYDTFHDFSMDADAGRQQIRVNIGSGNLFIRSTIAELAGPGVPVRADRIYNSRGSGGSSGADNNIGPWWTDFSAAGLQVAGDGSVTFSDGTGATWQFFPTASGFTKPDGLNATLSRDQPFLRYRLTYDNSGDSLIFSPLGWLLERWDRNGVGVVYSFTGSRISRITDAAGKSATFGYTGTRMTSAGTPGRQATMGYDSSNRLTTVTEAARPQWQMTYNAAGKLATMSGAGRTIAFQYDTLHRVTKVTQSRAGSTSVVTSFAYTDTGTVVTDPRGGTSTFEVDEQQRVTKAIDQLGRERSQTWTANSNVATTTDGFSTGGGQGNESTAEYDDLNNQTSIDLPTGAAVSAQYSAGPSCPGAQSGNPHRVKCQTDSQGNSSSMQYDQAGNLTQRSDTTAGGVGAVFSYTYENAAGTVCGGKAGQTCTATDPRGNVTSYQYTNGMVTTVTPPAPLGATTYTYDAVARLASVTDGNGHTTSYTYDAADRITRTTYHNGQTFTVTYNTDGTIASEVDSGNSVTVEAQYDLLGNKTREQTSFSASPAPAVAATVLATFDAAGNMTSTNETGTVNNYVYDAANQLIRTHPAGATCTATGTPAANSGCIKFTYDSNGQETQRLLPGGARQESEYDGSGRMTRTKAWDAAGAVRSDIAYTFTRSGQDTGQIQTRTSHLEQGITPGAVTSYGYDSLNRLTSAIEKSGTVTRASWQYGYDAAGNRTSRTHAGDTGSAAGTITYNYNAANQITSTSADVGTWAYDGAGNETRDGLYHPEPTLATTAYGDRQQVTSLFGTQLRSFGDGNSRRISRGTSKFLNTDLGLARTQGPQAALAVYYYRDHNGTALSYKTGNIDRYLVGDHLDSVVGVFSSAGAWLGGYSYSPYGESRHSVSTSTVPRLGLGYIGGETSGTNMLKLGARYYDASTARFTQMDPAGQETNPYLYGRGNPCNNSDPTGLITCENADDVVRGLGWGAFIAGGIGFLVGGPAGGYIGYAAFNVTAFAIGLDESRRRNC